MYNRDYIQHYNAMQNYIYTATNKCQYDPYLMHYGVLGMKWGQHLFGKDRSSGSSRSKSSAKNRVGNDSKYRIGGFTYESKALDYIKALKRERQTYTDLTAAPKKKASAYNFTATDGSTIFSGSKKGRKEAWQKQNAEMFAKALLTTDGRDNKNATEVDAGRKIMSDTKNWYNDDVKTSFKNLDNVNERYATTKRVRDMMQSSAYKNPNNSIAQSNYKEWSKRYSEVYKERETAINKEVKRLFGSTDDGKQFGGFYESTGNEYYSYGISDLAKDMLRHPSDMGYTSKYHIK